MLNGPGMVYVDSEHRTEYANTLPFDEIDDYPYWAVASWRGRKRQAYIYTRYMGYNRI